jgi:hypothetical protein
MIQESGHSKRKTIIHCRSTTVSNKKMDKKTTCHWFFIFESQRFAVDRLGGSKPRVHTQLNWYMKPFTLMPISDHYIMTSTFWSTIALCALWHNKKWLNTSVSFKYSSTKGIVKLSLISNGVLGANDAISRQRIRILLLRSFLYYARTSGISVSVDQSVDWTLWRNYLIRSTELICIWSFLSIKHLSTVELIVLRVWWPRRLYTDRVNSYHETIDSACEWLICFLKTCLPTLSLVKPVVQQEIKRSICLRTTVWSTWLVDRMIDYSHHHS